MIIIFTQRASMLNVTMLSTKKNHSFFAALSIVIACLPLFYSCQPPAVKKERAVQRSFYYWRSVFKLSAFEKESVTQLQVNRLYVKFFDVGWNESTRNAVPVAQLRVEDKTFFRQKEIVPVVFITNEAVFKMDSSQAPETGKNIMKLIKEMTALNGPGHLKELQIDCDWTSGTKEKYFALLRTIRSLDTTLIISATIRLHQVKYIEKTGVPPVDKGLLMCYNMGNLKEIATNNSIIETAELKKYIADLDKYPLQLDVALPVFEWNILIRNGRFAGLMPPFAKDAFNSGLFTKNNNRYLVNADTVFSGYTFKKNDVIRNEPSDYDVIMESAALIAAKLPAGRLYVSLYHLDSLTLSKYSLHEMENIYNSLH